MNLSEKLVIKELEKNFGWSNIIDDETVSKELLRDTIAATLNVVENLTILDVSGSLPDSTKEMLQEIINWEKDLSEYEALETKLRRKYIISERQ